MLFWRAIAIEARISLLVSPAGKALVFNANKAKIATRWQILRDSKFNALAICWALHQVIDPKALCACARERLVGFSSKTGNSRQPTVVLEAGEPGFERPRQTSGGENRAVGAE